LAQKAHIKEMQKAAWAAFFEQDPINHAISGTINKATRLMILIRGLTAGPAVSL
jgi:hypothetical protein